MLVTSALAQSNPVVLENQKQGNPPSEWEVGANPDFSIQGFATDISVNRGGTIDFKVNTDATQYRLDIYRLGYYNGDGARLIQSIQPSVPLPQVQPDPINDAATGLIDCGNWAVSASWQVPADATSGLYIARLVRADTGGASHIPFIVRDDASTSDILFQTSDMTWQAYNTYGGNSLYYGEPEGRAYKVSYNRPFTTRYTAQWDSLFNNEYPMLRWLEANGYDVTYSTGMDTERRGNLILNHKSFFSVGHDEYWSGNQRTNVEAARAAGVNLGFFTANEIFWKVRWENSIDGNGTPYRTMVCYKESFPNQKVDPSPEWTGTWRDPRLSPPYDGGRPENALTGTAFIVNGPTFNTMSVPAQFGAHRFWRDTSVASLAPGDSATFAQGILGYEWDEVPTNGFQPDGLMKLSLTTQDNVPILADNAANYVTGQATHSLTLYRHSSGALIFSSGTVNWAWGLDDYHDTSLGFVADDRIRQATVNLLADMGIQPQTLQSGLTQEQKSTDVTAPVSTITSPLSGASVQLGVPITIAGTATDAGGIVWGVDVSVDGGVSWQHATGLGNWSYVWTPAKGGPATVKTRAVDDSGNLETPSAGIPVTVAGTQMTIWSDSSTPTLADSGVDGPIELGVKFLSTTSGTIRGIRFYKSFLNSGPHVANLWDGSGTLLASVPFVGETGNGWQQINFANPVSINANAVYIASYHCNNGHYASDSYFFTDNGVTNGPLQAVDDGGTFGANGVFAYGTNSIFPNQDYLAANYWIDVAFTPAPPPTLTSITVTPANPVALVGSHPQFTANGNYSNGSMVNLTSQVTWNSSAPTKASIDSTGLASALSTGSTTISATLGSISGSTNLTVQSSALAISTTSLPAGSVGGNYSATVAGTGGVLPYSWSISVGTLPAGLALNASTGAITGVPTTTGSSNFTVKLTDSSAPNQNVTKAFSITVSNPVVSMWPASTVPSIPDTGADSAVEVGVKFRSDVSGKILGIRFYKADTNLGTHIGNLWSSTGTRLATATFTNETEEGWQQVTFSSPVSIAANTVYVASYFAPVAHFSATFNYFATTGVDNAPLHFLANGVQGGNGVFNYGSTSAFPSQSFNAGNYWVDVIFQASPPPVLNSIAVTPANPTGAVGATQQFVATGTYSDSSTLDLTSQVTWASSVTTKATINSSGLASALSAGSTSISATLGAKSGSTNFTVQSVPLSITTTSLGGGLNGSAYSATLSGSGGTLPYTWSILSGSLPPGLTLTANSIGGTPTAAGTFNFTVQLSDASAPVQTVTKALSITISNASYTIWPATTTPSLVDSGPDSAVEVGVKFRSDVAGTITGIRFYKASTNTGTHIGNLWSSTGTLMATATFTNETTSGWQQVNFSSPVAIAANTTYVASYFAPVAHFSANFSYFASAGADNAPLHALSNSAAGGNGVFHYGATSAFPNGSYNSGNYWVDVVFSATPPPTLSSISVTPANSSITVGSTQQFTATGTYSDNSTQNLTSQVTWASSVTAKATISSAGLATAAAAGSTTISATLGSVSGSTPLTVQVAPLVISTNSLPNGFAGSFYSTNVVATGGTSPYTWTVATGTLPAGLSIDLNSGVISGTPTAAGTASFSIRATDSASTPLTVTKALSITVTASLVSVAVTPVNPSITAGTTQQFTATATYSDSTTQNVTSQATWASSVTAKATINSAGLASGVSAGSTTISATLNSISGSTTLTVQPQLLAITTNALINGSVNTSYSATLAGSGGTPSYTWSIISGSLPSGLALNAGSGLISGAPLGTGTSNFTVQLSDSGAPVQTVTKALSITVTNAPLTIWSASAQPALIDGGDTGAMESGVKFTSDVSGMITGIRFYKATTNTGTHVGNLWTSTGTLLATATFTNETGSGWQQVNFSSPVSITPNTVYVASYFAPNGHYSFTANYFATSGMDNAPLHALSTGASGGNGLYGYGSSSKFPTNTYNAANYWVDVVFQAGPPPTLTSIAITPANPSALVGATQQFTATGTYSDASTKNITSQVTWASSVTAKATINSAGLASAVSAGTTSISATLGSVSNSTTLTVQSAPLSITTSSLPGATANSAYSANLAGSGGVLPYTWSIITGSLPAGLSLDAQTGAITGTPTGTGTFNFTVNLADSNNPVQNVSKALSITVSTLSLTIWTSSTTPSLTDTGPDSAVELGVKFRSDVAGTVTGVRFYKASTNTGTHIGNLWASDGTLLATATFTNETGSGWQQVNFSTPVTIAANTTYTVSYFAPNAHFSANFSYFSSTGADNGPLHALSSGASGGNGVFHYGATSGFPSQSYNSGNYWVDVVFTPAP